MKNCREKRKKDKNRLYWNACIIRLEQNEKWIF